MDTNKTKQSSGDVELSWKKYCRLQMLLDTLRSASNAPVPLSPEWLDKANAHLGEFQSLLEAFYQQEQELLERIKNERPRFSDRLSSLQREHDHLIKQIGLAMYSINRAANMESPSKEIVQAIQDSLNSLLASLEEHETKVEEIVLASHWTDLGGQDGV